MMHGLVEFIANLPVAVAALISLVAGAALAAVGLLGLTRLLPHRVRSTHNDVSGFILSIVGVIYAVLLAFIAVAVWQNFAQVDSLVQTEANLVGDLYRDTSALPDSTGAILRDSLFVYAEVVIQDEWPALAAGQADESAGWQLLDKFHLQLVTFHSADPAVSYQQADMVRTLNQLYDARRGRFHAATASLPAILWWNLLAGAVILMLFAYLFGVPHLFMHVAMVSLLGSLIGLVLLLIILLNNPFRGRSHVSVEPFNRLVRSVETMSYPHPR
jgi:hypothetical protein